MKNVTLLLLTLTLLSSCNFGKRTDNNTSQIEDEEDIALNLKYCDELLKIKNTEPINDSIKIPNWENVDLVISEAIEHELPQYSSDYSKLDIFICNEKNFINATFKHKKDSLLSILIDDKALEYYKK